MSTFFDALKTYEAKHGAAASSFAELMKAVIDHEITGEEANQVRCICTSVANAFEDQLASNAQYFGERHKKIDWWRRSGRSTDALGICPSEQANGTVLSEGEVALHRAMLMKCARNADAFLSDADGRARTESILAHYRQELQAPLETWSQRMEETAMPTALNGWRLICSAAGAHKDARHGGDRRRATKQAHAPT